MKVESDIFAANVGGPLRLLDKLAPGTLFLNADTVLAAGVSSYAASKESFRHHGSVLAGARNVRWFNLRLEHFFGPGEGADKFVTRTVRACLRGGELPLTRGTQKRDFIFIDDVVSAFGVVLRIAAERENSHDFYAGTGIAVCIRDVAERINRLCGSRGRLHFGAVPMRAGEPEEMPRPKVEPLDRYGWRPIIEWQVASSRSFSSKRRKKRIHATSCDRRVRFHRQ